MTGIKMKNTNNNLISTSKEDEVNENTECKRNNYRDFYNLYCSRVQHGYPRNQPMCALTSTCTTRSKLYLSYLLTRMTLKRQFFFSYLALPFNLRGTSCCGEILSTWIDEHGYWISSEKRKERTKNILFNIPPSCGIKRKGET